MPNGFMPRLLQLIQLVTGVLLTTILFLGLPLSVCGQELDKITLQLKWKHQFQFAGYYAAIEQGYYREVGLEVELRQRLGGPKRPVDSVLEGEATYGIEGTHLITSRLQGQPLVVLAAIFQHSPNIALALDNSAIKTAKDMAGKRVMSFGGTDVELSAMLLREGIPREGIDWQPMTYSIDSLIKGETDLYSAYLTNEPFFLEQKNIPYSIINPINYGVDFYGDFLFTTEAELAEHPQRVEAFRRASLRGWQYALQHPEEIIDLILQRYRSDKSREHLLYEARETLKLTQPEIVTVGHINPGRLAFMAEMLRRLGRVSSTSKLAGFIYQADARKQLSDEELVWLRKNPKIRVLGGHAPPLMYDDGQRPVYGMLVDYLDLLSAEYGLEIEYIRMPWAQAIKGMSTKLGPDLMPALRITEQRKEQFALSQPYLNLPWVIFSNMKARFIGGVEDLAGHKVSIPRGFVMGELLRTDYPEIKLVEVDTVPEALDLLASRKVDAYIGSLLLTSHFVEEGGLSNIKVAAPFPLQQPEHAMAVRKDWPELASLINRFFSQLTPQEHTEIRQRWESMRYEYGINKRDIWRWSLMSLAILSFGYGLFFIWNRSLQNEIKRRKLTEEALLDSVVQYQHLVQSVPHGIVEVNLQGDIIYNNDPFCEMLGLQETVLQGHKFTDYLVDKFKTGEVIRQLGIADSESMHQSQSLQLRAAEGHSIAVQIDFDRGLSAAENNTVILVVTDLTRSVTAEQDLARNEKLTAEILEVNKELESFAYSVSHDLRSPLRHVQGFAEILQESSRGELSTANYDYVQKILKSAGRMGRLIDDLLAFSRAGRSELQFREIDTALIVKEVVAGLQAANGEKNIAWRIDDLPKVVGDLATLRQVFSNLLENAVKYSAGKDCAEICVNCKAGMEELVFSVRDNGVGFDPEYAHKLFGVFSRLHRADQFEGSGIGLANVKRIINRHDGRVWAESGDGNGACFYFALPQNTGT